MLVENSSGESGFEQSALSAVKQWKYTAALENGEPVQSCLNTVRLEFKMFGLISPRFALNYKKTAKLANPEDLEEFKSKIDELDAITKSNSEYYRLNFLKAQYAELSGDKLSQLNYTEKVLKSMDHGSKEIDKLPFYQRLYSLYLSFNRIADALNLTDKILAIDEAKQYHQQYIEHKVKVENFLNSEELIVVKADIKKRKHWGFNLSRNKFSLADIEGTLTKLEIRCANKRHSYSIAENAMWNIPKTWQQCRVIIFGEDDTQFKLIEEPNVQIDATLAQL